MENKESNNKQAFASIGILINTPAKVPTKTTPK